MASKDSVTDLRSCSKRDEKANAINPPNPPTKSNPKDGKDMGAVAGQTMPAVSNQGTASVTTVKPIDLKTARTDFSTQVPVNPLDNTNSESNGNNQEHQGEPDVTTSRASSNMNSKDPKSGVLTKISHAPIGGSSLLEHVDANCEEKKGSRPSSSSPPKNETHVETFQSPHDTHQTLPQSNNRDPLSNNTAVIPEYSSIDVKITTPDTKRQPSTRVDPTAAVDSSLPGPDCPSKLETRVNSEQGTYDGENTNQTRGNSTNSKVEPGDPNDQTAGARPKVRLSGSNRVHPESRREPLEPTTIDTSADRIGIAGPTASITSGPTSIDNTTPHGVDQSTKPLNEALVALNTTNPSDQPTPSNYGASHAHKNSQPGPSAMVTHPPEEDKFFRSFRASSGQLIYVVQADICSLQTKTIVCPSNTTLDNTEGAAKAIREAAGLEMIEELDRKKKEKPLQIGDCITTEGNNLPAKNVLHVAFFKDKPKKPASKMKTHDAKKITKNCIKSANGLGDSVAIPAIGSGNPGQPYDATKFAEELANYVSAFCDKKKKSSLKNIILVHNTRSDLLRFCTQLSKSKHVKEVDTSLKDFEAIFVSNGTNVGDNTFTGAPENRSKSTARKAIDPSYTDKHGKREASGGAQRNTYNAQVLVPSPSSLNDVNKQNQKPIGAHEVNNIEVLKSDDSQRKGEKNEEQYSEKDLSPVSGVPGKKKRSRRLLKPGKKYDIKYDILSPVAETGDQQCTICMDDLELAVSLPCGHFFCQECIHPWLDTKKTCPCCSKTFGVVKGNQPEEGTMDVNTDHSLKIPGYENEDGAIVITYRFPSGTQSKNHPKPGCGYKGTTRRAYLPNCEEGREVLFLIWKAFYARLLFTIGRSVTTGREDQVTWNDVHHKTSVDGGPARFGYPDPTYLSRVKEELATKGIEMTGTSTSIKTTDENTKM